MVNVICTSFFLPFIFLFFTFQINNQTKSIDRFVYPNLKTLYLFCFVFFAISWAATTVFLIKSIIHVVPCYFQYWNALHFSHRIGTVTAFNFPHSMQMYWRLVSQGNVLLPTCIQLLKYCFHNPIIIIVIIVFLSISDQ